MSELDERNRFAEKRDPDPSKRLGISLPPSPDQCPTCYGWGTIAGDVTPYPFCPDCHGWGTLPLAEFTRGSSTDASTSTH